jgi:hypothetical protein
MKTSMATQERDIFPETMVSLGLHGTQETTAAEAASNGTAADLSAPSAEYRRRLAERQALVAQLSGKDAQMGVVRLMLAVVLLGLAWWWFGSGGHARPFSWGVMLLPVAAFVPAAVFHAQVVRRRGLARRAASVYEAGLARVEDRWASGDLGTGAATSRTAALLQTEPRGAFEGSLYAADLDLFGKTSLFALLSTARTRMGEDALADWLLGPAPVEEVLARQAAVTELRDRHDLREDAAVLVPAARPGSKSDAGLGAVSAVHTQELLAWAESPIVLRYGWVRYAALGIALLVAAAVVFWAFGGTRDALLGLVALAIAVFVAHRGRVDQVLGSADRALADLNLLAELLARLEREPVAAPKLVALQAQLLSEGVAASEAIGRLRRLGESIDSLDNLILRALNLPLLLSVQMAYAAEHWRQRHGGTVRRWLGAVGELEALLSLAAYSYEHPGDPFPEFCMPEQGKPVFAAEQLGHPLLPAVRCVRNSVQVGGAVPLLLVSGSNMSGKSTLLRAVGLNTVLAMAGAPVRAARLRMTPLRVGASILVNDSLAEGASRFYAEIQRLRAICDLAAGVDTTSAADISDSKESPALLFLLDELLEGTNSRDRRVGSEGILRTLVARGAIGIVSTHDLALTEPHAQLSAVNRHFQDSVQDGKMHFDYTLRDGVVTKSNGVELMRLVGLDV